MSEEQHVDAGDVIRMANQIAGFFSAYPHDDAVRETRNHLRSFWDPRMRRQLAQHIAAGGSGLTPLALEAGRQLGAAESPRAQ